MKHIIVHFTLFITLVWTLAGCANPGSGPDGGPYDETPPYVVGMTAPETAGKAGKKGTKITIRFSEAVQLTQAQEKVIVSPPQLNQPEIEAVGKRVVVELLDTLKENTTYTIDFGDAIKDATEGNPLGNYAYIFSTGQDIDTLEVSGHVLSANDLEPLKGVLVGLYPADMPREAFRTTPLTRVARTDGNGAFSIKGVAEGEYRVVCLADRDQDYRFSMKSEQIGWLTKTIQPSFFADTRQDTCWVNSTRYDSIRTVSFTHFLPDDLVLLGFTEDNQPRHRLKHNREDMDRLRIYMTAPSAQAPVLTPLNFSADVLRLEHSAGYDTLCYWICDTAVVNTDTLRTLFTYDESDDSTGVRSLTTDTLTFTPRYTLERRMKMKAEEQAKWQKALERRHKRGDYSQETPPVPLIHLHERPSSLLTPTSVLRLSFTQPLDSLNRNGIHLLLGPDSAQVEAPYSMEPVKGQPRAYTLRAEWRPEQRYTLRIDSASQHSIYGYPNDKEESRFRIMKLDEFGTIFFTLPDVDTTAVVQLLNGGGKVVMEQRVIPLSRSSATGARAEFYYVKPGTYYYRCFEDLNADGQWTSGNFDSDLLAEPMYYSPVQLNVKANFDFDQTWRVHELPLTRQKPYSLIKQREKQTETGGGQLKNQRRNQEKR